MRNSTGASLAIVLFLVPAVVGGCFSPKEPECAFSCDLANDPVCPDGYVCQSDNYCHRKDHPEECSDLPPTKLANGQACPGGATECLSGFCADGYCCDTACTGTCMACDDPNHLGACTPVTPGEQDPATCAGAGQCCQADQSCGTDGC